MTSPRWSSATKIIVTSLLVLAALLLLFTFREMIAPTIVAFLLTFVLGYPVNWVQQRTGWARTSSILSVYAMAVVAVVLVLYLVTPQLGDMTASLQRTVDDLLGGLESRVEGPAIVLGPFTLAPDEALSQAGNFLQGAVGAVTRNPMGLARGLTTSIVSLVYVVVLNFWLLKDMHKLQRSFFETIPSAYQEEIRRLTSNLSDIWEAFLRGQLVLSLVIGSITWICLVILGMPNATGLALLAGLMEFLPSIGPAISGTIGTVLAFFQGSTWLPVGNFFFAVIVGIVYAIIGQVESVYFIPRFVGGRVKLHPAVTFAGIIAGALTFGVLGILLAAPTIASTRELLYYITCKLTDRVPYEAGPSEPVLHIPGVIAGRKIEAVVFELDGTLTPVDMAAVDWIADRSDWMDRAMQPETRRLTVRRYLARLEAPINMFLNQLWRMRWFDTIERVQPNCDILRGMPPADQMALQPDIRNTMFHLANRYRLALVSTRDRAAVDQFIEREHLDSNLFGLVLAREDVRNTLPHVEPLMRVANAFGLEAGQLLVVSDTDVGLRAGRAAGMATSGVLGGIPLPDDLREADIVVQDVSHLGEYL